MKKSLLLYTVSGVFFCSYSSVSYALNATTLQPTSGHSTLEKHMFDNAKAGKRLKRMSSISTENGQPQITELSSAQNDEDSASTEVKSRRRPILGSSPTNPTTEEFSSNLRASAQPPSTQPMPPVLPALEKPETGEPELAQHEKPVQNENGNSAIEAHNGEIVTKHNVKIHDRFVAIDAQGENSTVKIMGGAVSSGFIALSASEGGNIDATAITVTTPLVGLLNMNGTINLKDSTVNVTGDHGAFGIVFHGIYSAAEGQDAHNAEDESDQIQGKGVVSKVMLKNTKLSAKEGVGIGIYGGAINSEVNLKDSEIEADTLLMTQKNVGNFPHILTLNADHSLLKGRVRTSEDSTTAFTLKNGTKWLLKANKKAIKNDDDSSNYAQFGNDNKLYSNLSMLNLQESTIMFGKPTNGHYQTLFVGSHPQQKDDTPNTPVVYSATGAAEIHLNSKWNGHAPVAEQETDRLVIGGDVSGTTVVYINLLEQEKDKERTKNASVLGEHMASLPASTHGISLIQVSGKANENSFKLAGDYMTIGASPYKYVLTAYAPGTSHASQNLFGKNDNHFWDFRLQRAALLPQVANYLVMPNALFSSGLADVNNQNMLLDNMRTTVFEPEDNKKKGIFLSTYSEKVTLFSNRDPLHYGYGADVNYNALQLGVVLAMLEGKDISTHFGLLGTYGKLAFTPREMKDCEKTTLDKWSLTAYSGIQHSSGIYVNTLLSYATVKGNVTTALIGNAAKLDGTKILNASATIGQKLATGIDGLMFEPQAQFVYQSLMFDILSDADGFEVDMSNPHQWLVRIGGRLTKNLPTTEEGNAVSFYGKLNVIRTFGDGKTIQIGDTFPLDPTGSSIESGFGVNAYLFQNIALYGDISYRKKLQKAGVSGTSFSGGISYRF
ncbi:Type V secretory pathway, adhesin AidA [Candidatus Bartonella washoeensis]|uniref:Outer membrane autotransporter barrel domain-containing protein n=1 Tax=Candidatus Bartonella washoeensis Sb944nv TaxID=1094563 RepID=J1J3Y2_9HYPH|nr:autotransporter outer membrane beta-barrel domain-containing protein [Bartonella washoeensis]EJF78837.1 outer membrane autotransporter barrel domain-containing protein [Bartonella washoeensis Sb944nv]SPU27320.1 Type V secretory pathway, adhesin AidA [Bartonella washoeensis]